MSDSTDYTPSVDDNLLGLTNQSDIDIEEARGVIRGEALLLNLEEDIELDVKLILELHRTVFGHLYDWAGKWRNSIVTVGKHTPPSPDRIANLMYQFADELKYKLSQVRNEDDILEVLCYCHHKMVHIHPFNNGNGRTARLLTNLVAFKNGYNEINIYHRTGKQRHIYINAIREADNNNFDLLREIVKAELKPFS